MASDRDSKGNEPVPPHIRETVLERDNHRCQVCDAAGPEAGGFSRIEIHHKDPNREADRHDFSNLLSLCQECHRWMHKMPTADDVPITLSDADKQLLQAHDYEILQVLADNGPMTTGELREALEIDLTGQSIRERLWRLMGLDDRVETRETQLIDQDVETGQWGLPDDIGHSERGRIPPGFETLILRIEDEQVKRAVDRGVSREAIADSFGITKRVTYYRENRARAYQFPLDDLKSGRGRPARVDPEERNAIPHGEASQLRIAPIKTDQSAEPDASAREDCDAGDSGSESGEDTSRNGSDEHVTA